MPLGGEAETLLRLSGDGVPALKDLTEWNDEKYNKALGELTTSGRLVVRGREAEGGVSKKSFGCWIYLPAILVWIIVWCVLVLFELVLKTNLGLFGSRGLWPIFVLPPNAVAGVVLVSNLVLWWKPSSYSGYESELKIIDVVERHASFFLIGSSAVFFFASFSIRDLGLRFSFSAFIIYETLSLVCLATVLLLYWVPREWTPENLVTLRHLKTIPFTYAVSFFLAALMTITTSVLPQVVP